MIHFFEKALYFLPFFILLLVSVLFFSLSLSVIGTGSVFDQFVGLLMQNIPTAIIVFLFFLSKKHPKAGGLILICFWAFFMFFFHAFEHLSTFILILPVLISGVLLLFQQRLKG